MTGPNLWFSLAIAGVLLLYWEFFRPGLVFPAAAGVFLLIFGGYRLAVSSPACCGVALLALAGLLFLSELSMDTRFTGGVGGTVALMAGALTLRSGPPGIHPAIAVAGGLLVGPLMTLLATRARRARTNKRADL